MQKHKFASISLTVRERAILSKFLIHSVSQQSTLANFVQVLEQNACFPLGGHYTCQCVLFLVFVSKNLFLVGSRASEYENNGKKSWPLNLTSDNILWILYIFYPTALNVKGIVFTHGVRMDGWAAGKVCPGSISKTVRCRKLILDRDIG